MKTKLKGFTVLETLFSLMLISIAIALTYSLFAVIGKQMSLYEKENTQVIKYNLFNTVIKNDIDKSHQYSISKNSFQLIDYQEKIIKYSVEENYILRENYIKVDTFKINIVEHSFLESNSKKGSVLNFKLLLLDKPIHANYFLTKNITEIINNHYLNEN